MGPRFRRATRHRSRGQSLAEFALVVPLFMAILAGVIQFGLIFWAQNTLTQIVRDTGRWTATQQAACAGGNATELASLTAEAAAVTTEANSVAAGSSLLGYVPATPWTNPAPYNPALDAVVNGTSDGRAEAAVVAFSTPNSLAVAWIADSDGSYVSQPGCPPPNNQTLYHVVIKINHTVPTFFPGMQYLPGLGTCDSSGCHTTISSTAEFRMEPRP